MSSDFPPRVPKSRRAPNAGGPYRCRRRFRSTSPIRIHRATNKLLVTSRFFRIAWLPSMTIRLTFVGTLNGGVQTGTSFTLTSPSSTRPSILTGKLLSNGEKSAGLRQSALLRSVNPEDGGGVFLLLAVRMSASTLVAVHLMLHATVATMTGFRTFMTFASVVRAFISHGASFHWTD